MKTADGGTLFLDEIGDLPLVIQPKLLRLLQEREDKRLGENVTRAASVRIIAATIRMALCFCSECSISSHSDYLLAADTDGVTRISAHGCDLRGIAFCKRG